MNNVLFYNEYEAFYDMAQSSSAFKKFCTEAYGEDFSQDGFSDIKQINRILEYIPHGGNVHILDIGCGNGKMLKYLQGKTCAYIHGFDYSETAVMTALKNSSRAEFKVGLIDDMEYTDGQFDLITSMDTMYFTKDMTALVSKIFRWLKTDGVFFTGYQEGDLMEKTNGSDSTVLAQAFRNNGISYNSYDITKETYDLMNRKRCCAQRFKSEFARENRTDYYSMLMGQTESADLPFCEYRQKNARYLYIARKQQS